MTPSETNVNRSPRTTDSEDAPVTQGQASIETIIHELTGIRARLGESVGALQQQLLGEATRLDDLHTEIAGHIVHLRELHGIEVHEDTLRDLVRRYLETQRTADEVSARCEPPEAAATWLARSRTRRRWTSGRSRCWPAGRCSIPSSSPHG